MKVRDPTGQTWRVRRRWLPWRRRLRSAGVPDLPIGLGDDPVSLIIGIVLLVVLIPFLILALVVALELLLLLLLLPLAVLARIALGHHWTVEVRRGVVVPWWEAEAGTWRESGELVRGLIGQIERGELPPRTLSKDP